MTSFRQHLGLIRSRFLYYRNPLHTRKMIRFYNQFLTAGDLCFDIGTHLGNRTNAWQKMGAQVISLEPQPQCLEFLQGKFKNNPAVTIIPKAVSDIRGKTTLHISSLTPTISTLADQEWQRTIVDKSSFKVEWDQDIEVDVTTLDDLIDEFGLPKFCKIDVEGLEFNVLRGLSQPVAGLSLEYLSDTASIEAVKCIERIEELGSYEFNWSFAESLKLESEDWVRAEQIKELFAHMKSEDRSGDFYARLVK